MSGRPDRIGPYEVLGVLGDGGMGRVYRARDPRFDRMVAVKVLHPHLASSPELARRFTAEAVIQAKLRHPNIVAVYDFVADGETLGIVMEFVDGRSLEKVISDEGGPLAPERCVALMAQVLSAMAYAHGQGLVHRDVKPSNILVETISGEEHAKVMDFGIAKILGDDKLRTATGAKMGTLAYMSPEQVKSPKNVDARSDVYSLGATLYEMATGRAPFDAGSEFELMQRIVGEEPVAPSRIVAAISPGLDRIVLRAMARRPEDRYSTCEQFRVDLQAKLVPSVPRIQPPPLKSPIQRNASTAIDGMPGDVEVFPSAHPARPIVPRVAMSSEGSAAAGAASRKPKLAAAALITVLGVGLAMGILRLAPSFFGLASTQRGATAEEDVAARAELMADGNRLVGAGNFAEALDKYREVSRRDPTSAAARDAVAKTEWLLAEQMKGERRSREIEGHLSAAREAARRFEDRKVVEEAEAVLALEPDNAEAKALQGDARTRLSSRSAAEVKQVAETPLKNGRAIEMPLAPQSALPAVAAQTSATARIVISFISPIPAGDVMVSLNDKFIFRKSFAFGAMAGGGTVDGTAVVPSGRGLFKVWLIAPDRSLNQYKELSAFVPGGETRSLRLELDSAMALSLTFR